MAVLTPLDAPHICLTSELPRNWLSSLNVLTVLSHRLTLTFWRSSRALDSSSASYKHCTVLPRSPLPQHYYHCQFMSAATRQYMPPNGRLQTTNLVRSFDPCLWVSPLTSPWDSHISRTYRMPLRPCARRQSSSRKCYVSGACRVHPNSTSAKSTYVSAPSSTRP